jgi:4-hydroxy-tetrahydrodipicolinate synthase
MSKEKYRGVIVPMVTPFTDKGKIDEMAVGRLVSHITGYHCHPFVLGTTGEALSLTSDSKQTLVKVAHRANGGKMTLYAGIASTCLEDSIRSGNEYIELGADVLVAHLPGYYAISIDSMYRYYMELADHVSGPLMLYNISSTTHMSIPVDLVVKLSEHPNIVGLKDSERDVERLDTCLGLFRNRTDFAYQLGWAAKSGYALERGADGIVPSTANAFPDLYFKLYKAATGGNHEEAERYQKITDEISSIYQANRLLSEALPSLKVMLEDMGICQSHAIAPCYATPEEEKRNIRMKLQEYLHKQ